MGNCRALRNGWNSVGYLFLTQLTTRVEVRSIFPITGRRRARVMRPMQRPQSCSKFYPYFQTRRRAISVGEL